MTRPAVGSLVYLGLGSNQGNPPHQLRRAITDLSRTFGALRVGPLFRTIPISTIRQPSFLNTVVELRCKRHPHELLDWVKAAEREAGREPGLRNGPRPLDIDLLVFGALELESERLTLPHPRIRERAFVLAPLASLAPWVRLKPDGRNALEAWTQHPHSSPNASAVTRVLWSDCSSETF